MTEPTPTGPASAPNPEVVDAIRDAVDAGFPSTIADLANLVRIPSVSWPAFDPAHVARSADAVAALLRETGVFDLVEVRRALVDDGSELGQPAVVASRPARNGRPTVLLYAHHDVQPPGKDEDWETSPFEPTQRGDRLYGRGAADDKAGVMAHVGAVRAFAEAAGDFDLGLAVFIEGEEEWASRSFANFLRENRDLLAADAIIVADSGNWDVDTPAITVALRGAVAFNVRIRTLEHASHSGMFGGAVPDAMLAAVRVLDTMWNADGSVAIAGLTSADLEPPAYDEAQLRAEAGLVEGVTPIGSGSILSRIWAQPSVTVTGIDAPDVANASNTLVPEVRVRISARIAPGQDAGDAYDAIRAHLEAAAPFGVKLGFEDVDKGQAFLVDTGGWAVEETRSAMTDAWGRAPIDIGVGGSIPFIAELVEEFPEAQILVTGVEDPDSRAHSPNESLHLGVFKRALLSEALLFARLDARGSSESAEPA
ncbi:acetylornithine deacetylase/succinyl-diaminopimelate desuccinylase-like protein [Agromyces terreus]|uniref:Acetylornithine deacetylase/succinyl-diaminopimelate desuccinylase-like protein n=1 Tax=Agromyces terreus TaxID=424795 RepID=A0A9X2KFL6_9MICO|nr:dipeptidase [Agromyces terreus]MCP2371907.1 acetylornithine deacetylase/succinyl-diaminopimelate desuccinylase-like protein [Agromyces terreus]